MRHSISLITAMIFVLFSSVTIPLPSVAQESTAQKTAQESAMPTTQMVEEVAQPKKLAVASSQSAVQPPVRKFTKTKKILIAAAVICLVAAAIAIPVAVGVHAHNRHEHQIADQNQKAYHGYEHYIQDQNQKAHHIIKAEEHAVSQQIQSVNNVLKKPNLPPNTAAALFSQKKVLEAEQSELIKQDLLAPFARSFNVLRFKEGLGGLLYASP